MYLHLKHATEKGFNILISIVLILLLFPILAIAATSSSKTISILNRFPLESNSVVANVMRSIGWAIVTGLHWLVSGLESSIYSINDAIGGFFTSSGVIQLEQKVFPLALALVTLVILYIGLLSMFKPPNFSSIVGNFIVGIIVFISLPYLLSTAYSFTTQAISYINGDSNSLQLMSDKILIDNITDTTRFDAEGFGSTTLRYKSYFAMSGANTSKINGIDVNELVDPEKMKYPDVWKNKIVTNENGTAALQGLNSGQYGLINMPVMSQYYYRWNVDWFTILATLIVTAAALLLSGIKIARLIYELAINQLMAQVMGLLDIVTAQRLKKCIQLLISTLGTLFAVFLMLQMYILGTSYVSAQANLNIFVRIILMLALAFAVIDGPNLFEQIFGVDAGIRSGMRSLYGLKAAGSLIGGGVAMLGGKAALDTLRSKGIMGSARSILSGAGSMAGGAGGVAAGIAKGVADNRKRISAVRQGFSSAAGNVAGGVAGAVAGASAGGINRNPSASSAQNPDGRNTENDAKTTAAPDAAVGQQSVSGFHESVGDSQPEQQPFNGPQSPTESVKGNSPSEPDKASASISDSDTSRTPDAKKKGNQPKTPDSIGGFIRSKAYSAFQQSKPVSRTRHVYGLTRGSMEKHGDKLVDRETRAQSLMQEDSGLSHHQAVQQTKMDIKNEKIINHREQGAEKK